MSTTQVALPAATVQSEMDAMAQAAWDKRLDAENVVATLRQFWAYSSDPVIGQGYDRLADLIEAKMEQASTARFDLGIAEDLSEEMWHMLGIYPYNHAWAIWSDLHEFVPRPVQGGLALEDDAASTIDNAAKRIARTSRDHAIKLAVRLLHHAAPHISDTIKEGLKESLKEHLK
tara:strand:+ start:531 stop:1052 length:522 start_codon:yes stop_codon:yes gene_type:complete